MPALLVVLALLPAAIHFDGNGFVSAPLAEVLDADMTLEAWINYHRHVFRATGDTAELRISDWGESRQAGIELMFNFIEVQPYLED